MYFLGNKKNIKHVDMYNRFKRKQTRVISLSKVVYMSCYSKLVCGRVVRWSWVTFQGQGVLLIWMMLGQGPIALAEGAGLGEFDILLSSIFSLFFLPHSGRWPDID